MSDQPDVGALERCQGEFRNQAGALIDPDAVFCKVRTPAGVVTTYTYLTDAALVRSSAGIYYVDVSVTESNRWWFKFYSTGSGQAAKQDYFDVQLSRF